MSWMAPGGPPRPRDRLRQALGMVADDTLRTTALFGTVYGAYSLVRGLQAAKRTIDEDRRIRETMRRTRRGGQGGER